jgi:hypothetical protein
VIGFFDVLSNWLENYRTQNKFVTTYLNAHILINMTLLIINTNHALGIANALNFWFLNFHIFSYEIIFTLLDILVKIHFYNLFLHWSKNVRDVFAHFLCYRIIPFYECNTEKNRMDLEKSLYLINKNLCIVEKAGDLYKTKILQWQINKTGKKQKNHEFYEIQKEVCKMMNDDNYLKSMEIRNKMGLKLLADLKEIRITKKYSTNTGLERSTNDILSKIGTESKKIRFRNYEDLVNFEKIIYSSLRPKYLVYCFGAMQDFSKTLSKYKNEKEKIETNPNLCPILVFQNPIDQYEFYEDADENE